MRRDVLSAYAASAAKILSWVTVSGLVYRYIGRTEFAVLALIRGTIGILNYTTLGLSPAMIRLMAETRRSALPADNEIDYFNASSSKLQSVYANGLLVALICGAIGIAISIAYAMRFRSNTLPRPAERL